MRAPGPPHRAADSPAQAMLHEPEVARVEISAMFPHQHSLVGRARTKEVAVSRGFGGIPANVRRKGGDSRSVLDTSGRESCSSTLGSAHRGRVVVAGERGSREEPTVDLGGADARVGPAGGKSRDGLGSSGGEEDHGLQ